MSSTLAADALKAWNPASPQDRTENEINVIDFFSGCGGMTLGFDALRQQGLPIRMLGGVDINEISLETYKTNFGAPGIVQDVRALSEMNDVDFNKFLSKLDGYDANKPLIVIGCAPCQGFSAHTKTNMSRIDKRNDLVSAFALVAVRLKPEFIIMENVPELLRGRFASYFESFKSIVNEHGYKVSAEIHNAAEFGTPQKRMRALVVASREFTPELPSGTLETENFRTVRDAIGSLPVISAGQPSLTDQFHRSANHRQSTIEVMKKVPHDGGSRPIGVGPECLDKVKGFSDVYGRLAWNKPSITITHYARNPASGRFTHPEQDRGLTMREAARLQGFPDNFHFTGKNDDVYRQIGEAVPPTMSAALALNVYSQLHKFEKDAIGDTEI